MAATLLFAVLAVGAAFSADDLPPPHRAVLTHLADFADDTGKAWPSVDTLVARTGLARRTVLTCLAELSEAGWIVPERRWVNGRVGGRPLTTRYEVRASGGSIARQRTGRHVTEEPDGAGGALLNSTGGALLEDGNGAGGAPFNGAGGARDGAPRVVEQCAPHALNSAGGAPDPIRDPIRNPIKEPITVPGSGSDGPAAPASTRSPADPPAPSTALPSAAGTSRMLPLFDGAEASSTSAVKRVDPADEIYAVYRAARTAKGLKGTIAAALPATDKSRNAIKKLMSPKEGNVTLETLCAAAQGIWEDSWRREQPAVRAKFSLISRDIEHVQGFAADFESAKTRPTDTQYRPQHSARPTILHQETGS